MFILTQLHFHKTFWGERLSMIHKLEDVVLTSFLDMPLSTIEVYSSAEKEAPLNVSHNLSVVQVSCTK